MFILRVLLIAFLCLHYSLSEGYSDRINDVTVKTQQIPQTSNYKAKNIFIYSISTFNDLSNAASGHGICRAELELGTEATAEGADDIATTNTDDDSTSIDLKNAAEKEDCSFDDDDEVELCRNAKNPRPIRWMAQWLDYLSLYLTILNVFLDKFFKSWKSFSVVSF